MSTTYTRTCAHCGAKFEAGKFNARFCSDAHRKAHSRAHKPGSSPAPIPTPPTTPPASPGQLEAAVRRALTERGALDTPEGAQALILARRIESGTEPGTATAALGRQLDRLLESVRAINADPTPDYVEILRSLGPVDLSKTPHPGASPYIVRAHQRWLADHPEHDPNTNREAVR